MLTTSEEDEGRSFVSSFVDEHVRLFNAAVDSGAWEPLVDRFADDGVLEFVGVPVGPFVGHAAIHEAYVQSPPDDTIMLTGPPIADEVEVMVSYRWIATGATGTMRFTQRGGRIARLVVTFD